MVACQIDLSAAPILSPRPATRRLNLKQRSANRPEPACKVLHKLFTVICFSSGNSFGVGNSCSLFSRIVRSRRRHRGDKEYADESNRPGNTARPNYSFQAGNRLWMLKYSWEKQLLTHCCPRVSYSYITLISFAFSSQLPDTVEYVSSDILNNLFVINQQLLLDNIVIRISLIMLTFFIPYRSK